MIDYYETKSQPITKVMVWQAYKEVKSNAGSGGIDKMSWEYLQQNASTELYLLWNRLSSGSYFLKPVKQVAIPKKGGGERLLGIPTILDRIAQQVARRHLERILEPKFHPSSFGYRPKRNCHQAVEQALAHSYNHDFAIDLDIKGFFDNIDHDLMLKALGHYCSDKWILMYADDIVVHCKTEKQAKFMLRQIQERMKWCQLQLHEQKSKIVNLRGFSLEKYPKGFDFLGFTIKPRPYKVKGTGVIKSIPCICVSQKSKSSIMEKFREMNLHKRRKPLEQIAKEINPVLRGIINYYHHFWKDDMRMVWFQLNARLLKWVKWEKDLYKKASVRYLKTRYDEKPWLFAHWLLVYP